MSDSARKEISPSSNPHSSEATLADLPPPFSSAASQDLPQVPDYEILGEIGRGGMGIVYQAQQKSLNRVVALKMIRDDALSHHQHLARFRTEAAAVARLQHPNIVQLPPRSVGLQFRIFWYLAPTNATTLGKTLTPVAKIASGVLSKRMTSKRCRDDP